MAELQCTTEPLDMHERVAVVLTPDPPSNQILTFRCLAEPTASSKETTVRIRLLVVLAMLATFFRADPVAAQSMPVPGTWNVVSTPNAGTEASGNTLLDVEAISATN